MSNLKAKEYENFENIKIIREDGTEYWSARELSKILEYKKWENFDKVIDKAMLSCKNSGENVEDNFTEITKITIVGATKKEIIDYELSRYASYLIIQNCNPENKRIALLQTYFATQTQRQMSTKLIENLFKISQNNKLETITKLFEGKEVRSIWDAEKEEYFFSVVDVINALSESPTPKRYWTDLKRRLIEEGSQLYEKIVQLKMKSKKDGKNYLTDTLDTKGVLRLIESVPSKKAEPFKLWLAQMGSERIDEVFDPEIAIKRAVNYYRNKGYSDKWIEARLKGILTRNKLTDVWKENGIEKDYEYAILTNEIYKSWSGMKASEYKKYKNIRKESLRDNMTDIEVALTDLGEIATRELAKEHRPYGLEENKNVAKMGGHAAKVAREDLEKNLGKTVISHKNALDYQYEKTKELDEGKKND